MIVPTWVPVFPVFLIFPVLTSLSSITAGEQPQWGLPLLGVPASAIISVFDPPTSPFGHGHRGVDFPAHHGQSVTAVGSGAVVFAGSIAGKPVVSIELSHWVDSSVTTVRATYEPVSATVNTGEFISSGTVIGIVDFSTINSGHCRDRCLHFGLKVMAEPTPHYLNPLVLWRSRALLQPSLVVHRSLIAGEQFQKSSVASRH